MPGAPGVRQARCRRSHRRRCRAQAPAHLLPFPHPAADEEVMHVGRRVYVSNLAWRTSWQDLKDK